jgi:predicted type IV restriction endonuclease
MPALESVKAVIDRFQRNLPAYKSGKYNETQARVEFIDPLFIALGWDVHEEMGYKQYDLSAEEIQNVEGRA